MKSSRKSTQQSMSAAAQIAAYLDRIFGRRKGIVLIAFGSGGHFNEKDTYRPETWEQQTLTWPRDRDALISEALEVAPNVDVYISPTLRTAPNRRKGSSDASEYLWADVDTLGPNTFKRLDTILSDGSFLVHSGQPGHLHVYIRLDDFYPPQVVEDLNKQLMRFLGGDSKWDETSVLRLPGTLNHKSRAAGRSSHNKEADRLIQTLEDFLRDGRPQRSAPGPGQLSLFGRDEP